MFYNHLTTLNYKTCMGLWPVDRTYHASELETLQAIEQHGDLNPVQRGRLKELRAAGGTGSQFGIESPAGTNLGVTGGGTAGGFDTSGTDLKNLFSTQAAEEAKLLSAFSTKSAGQESLPDAYTRLTTAAGIPGMEKQVGTFQTQIAGVQDLLNKLEDSINERTKGTMTTEAQRQRLLAAEQYPLGKELGLLGTAETPILEGLNTARGDVSTQLGLEQSQQAKELKPEELALSTFSDRAAREVTGFTTERKNQLDIYLNKLTSDQAVTLQEKTAASDLAKMEKEYELKKEQLKTLGKYGTVKYDPVTGTYVTIGGGGGAGTGGGTTFTPSGDNSSGGGKVDPLGLFS